MGFPYGKIIIVFITGELYDDDMKQINKKVNDIKGCDMENVGGMKFGKRENPRRQTECEKEVE